MTQMIGQENVGMEIEDTLCLDAKPRPAWKLIDKCVECFDFDEKHYLLVQKDDISESDLINYQAFRFR
jgi:hypothetical protein